MGHTKATLLCLKNISKLWGDNFQRTKEIFQMKNVFCSDHHGHHAPAPYDA